jgi:predicted Zn-dependent peptidase
MTPRRPPVVRRRHVAVCDRVAVRVYIAEVQHAGRSGRPTRAEPRPPAADPSHVAYDIATHRLDNDLRVFVSSDPGLGVVAVNLWYDVGSRHEDGNRWGFAHLFEHLMFQGSRHVRPGEHMERLHSHGASLNATTSFDRTNYFESFPAGALDLALWLEADRLAYLADALDQNNLDTQRDVVFEERRQRMDNIPYGTALERLLPLLFAPEHPYGHLPIGDMGQLAESTLAEVRMFHARYYVPANAVLTIVGDVDVAGAVARAERFFGHIPAGERPSRQLADPLGRVDEPTVEAVDDDVPVPALYLGCRLPADRRESPDLGAAELALGILGFGETSRLFRRLVRREQTASSVSAYASRMISGNSFGILTVRGDESVDLERLADAVREEVAELAEHGPADDELQIAIAGAEREWLDEMATAAGRADAFSQFGLLFDDPRAVNDYLPMLRSLEPDDIRSAVREWLVALSDVQLRYRPPGVPR